MWLRRQRRAWMGGQRGGVARLAQLGGASLGAEKIWVKAQPQPSCRCLKGHGCRLEGGLNRRFKIITVKT